MKARRPKRDKKKRRVRAKRPLRRHICAASLEREREAKEARIFRKYSRLLNRQAVALVREQADLSRIDPFLDAKTFLGSTDASNPTE
jgi:hypothetical protein